MVVLLCDRDTGHDCVSTCSISLPRTCPVPTPRATPLLFVRVCQSFPQTPSSGLRHPSFGARCRKAVLGVCQSFRLSFPLSLWFLFVCLTSCFWRVVSFFKPEWVIHILLFVCLVRFSVWFLFVCLSFSFGRLKQQHGLSQFLLFVFGSCLSYCFFFILF